MDRDELMRILRTLILELFPELRGYHFPIRARVVKVHEQAGRQDALRRPYSVDVRPLRPDGTDDPEAPIIPDVEIPVLWAGPGRGIYALPVVGAIVRVGFYYHDPAHPFVDAILADGYDVPAHPLGSLIIQHSDGTRIEIDAQKNITIRTPENQQHEAGKQWKVVCDTALVEATSSATVSAPVVNLGASEAREAVVLAARLKAWIDQHTHPIPNGVTGPPTSPLSGHEAQQVFGA